jgi:4-amino-4-deoxy-L-arabinose transferase and related glycosyltransferases of PMT family
LDKAFEWPPVSAGSFEAEPRGGWRQALGASWFWFAAFVVLILVNRIAGLDDEVVNWDEDTFMLMAQDVLRGHLPYVAAFDNKPPGIFLWTAGVFEAFGTSLVAVRLTSGLWMAAAAAFAFLIARRFAPVTAAGVAVALMLTATFYPIAGGFSSTEWPCVALLLAAFYLQIAHGGSLAAAFGAGLCAALAVLFRTNAAVAVAMIGLLYAAGSLWKPLGFTRAAVLPFAAGVILPPLALALVYAAQGQFHTLWLANVTVPFSYSRGQNGILIATKQFFEMIGLMVTSPPFTLAPLLVLTGLGASIGFRRARPRDLVLLTAVSGAALVAILVCGTFYPHYLVQALPFAAPWVAMGLRPRWLTNAAAVAVAAVFVGQAWAGAVTLAHFGAGYDIRHAADALRPVLKPDDKVWAMKSHLILVYLDRPPVSPAALHPSNIVRPSIMEPLIAAGYVPRDVFEQSVASLPAFIVTDAHRPAPYYLGEADECFATLLNTRYAVWRQFGDVRLYRRKPGARPLHCPATNVPDTADFRSG